LDLQHSTGAFDVIDELFSLAAGQVGGAFEAIFRPGFGRKLKLHTPSGRRGV